MPESLLTPSGIKLFGRVVDGLQLKRQKGSKLGENRFLSEQLNAPGARLARIYAFSFEGQYYELARPTIYLVHGEGTDVPATPPVSPGSRMARGPSSADDSGLPSKGWEFSSDLKMWEYDKGDFSMRLDLDSGPLDQILLDVTVAETEGAHYSGRAANYSGRAANYSGRAANYSGRAANYSGRAARGTPTNARNGAS